MHQNPQKGFLKSQLLGTTPRVTVKANKIYIYINFQGAAVLALGLDFENHCPKAFLILEASSCMDSVQKGCKGIGGVAVAPAEPPQQLSSSSGSHGL